MSSFYLDKNRHTGISEFTNATLKAHASNPGNVEDAGTPALNGRNANYKSGFAARHTLLVDNAEVNAEIPLNRYGFFGRLHNELLPNSKIELKITFESDANLVWRTGGADCPTDHQISINSTSYNLKRKWIENFHRQLFN